MPVLISAKMQKEDAIKEGRANSFLAKKESSENREGQFFAG
jgi:hypothetical protein